jgi:hypothetical protein
MKLKNLSAGLFFKYDGKYCMKIDAGQHNPGFQAVELKTGKMIFGNDENPEVINCVKPDWLCK